MGEEPDVVELRLITRLGNLPVLFRNKMSQSPTENCSLKNTSGKTNYLFCFSGIKEIIHYQSVPTKQS